MDEEDQAELARKGLRAVELLDASKVAAGVKESVSDAAEGAALRAVAAVGRWTGKDRSPARSRAARAVDLGNALASWDAEDAADFDARVREAAREAREREAAERMDLAALRRSFPEASRELAILIFNCVDLLEDVSDDAEGEPPSAAELERKEKLLASVAALLAPKARESLVSFVDHVVAISRRHRRS